MIGRGKVGIVGWKTTENKVCVLVEYCWVKVLCEEVGKVYSGANI